MPCRSRVRGGAKRIWLQCRANGRFKGGYITRQDGRSDEQIHAIQLEIALRAYMEEVRPFRHDAARAAIAQPALRAMLEVALDYVEGLDA